MATETITYEARAELAERAHLAPLDAIRGATSYLANEWGEHGYRIGYAGQYGTPDHPYLFACSHSDGSRFAIVADRWGNARQLT